MFKMKEEKIEMKRELWEYFRRYRRTPFQKKYLENQRTREKIDRIMQYENNKLCQTTQRKAMKDLF